jgi:hypothetical protein
MRPAVDPAGADPLRHGPRSVMRPLRFWHRQRSWRFAPRETDMPTIEQIQPYTPLIIMALNGLIAG